MQQENGKGIYNAGPALIKNGHITLTALHKETEIVSGNHSRTLILPLFTKRSDASRSEGPTPKGSNATKEKKIKRS